MTEFHSLRTSAMNHADLREKLKAQFGLADDDQALTDTLDGMSDLKEMLLWAARRVSELEADAEGIKLYEKQMKAKRERKEAAAEALRTQIWAAMIEGNVQQAKDAVATVSLRQSGPKVVYDETQIPAGYWKAKPVEYVLDKDAIRAELEAGRPVAGAQLSNGSPVLTLRVK